MADPPNPTRAVLHRTLHLSLRLTFLLTLLIFIRNVSSAAIADMEVREAVGCSWGHVRLWCPEEKKIGVVSSGVLVLPGNWSTSACPLPFLPPSSPLPPITHSSPSPPPLRRPRLPLPLPFPTTMAGLTAATPRYHIRHPVNYRCSGRSTCNFNLKEDYPASQDWSPGVVLIRYVCMGDELVRYCNEEISGGEGFLSNPTYPRYYQGGRDCWWRIVSPPGGRVVLTLLDLSIRGVSSGESECVDTLSVREGSRMLFTGCGDWGGDQNEESRRGGWRKRRPGGIGEDTATWTIQSEGNQLQVVLSAKSAFLYPKRGVLLHYRSVAGCVTPHSPQDGYLVSRNESHALFMCCVDHVFPDTRSRTRHLVCWDNWNDTVPDCVRDDTPVHTSTSSASFTPDDDLYSAVWFNSSIHEPKTLRIAPVEQPFVMTDVILPLAIMASLFITNAVILAVIFHLRRKERQHSRTTHEVTLMPPQQNNHNNHRQQANGGNNGVV